MKDGKLAQEQADEIYNSIKNNQAACNGNGSAGIGKKYGAGFGQGNVIDYYGKYIVNFQGKNDKILSISISASVKDLQSRERIIKT